MSVNWENKTMIASAPWPTERMREALPPPTFWCVDTAEGNTIAKAATKKDAVELMKAFQSEHYEMLVLRHYVPTPEQYEKDYNSTKENRQWNSGQGGAPIVLKQRKVGKKTQFHSLPMLRRIKNA